jgi:16S rRNA processing protein RimM
LADEKLDLVAIGKVSKPRGIHGEAFLIPLTDFPERFEGLESVHAQSPDGRPVTLDIEYVRQYGNRLGIKFKNADSPDDVVRFRDYTILVSRDAVHPLPGDTFYVFEVIGMTVETASGTVVGKVIDVLSYPANDVYVVDRLGEEVLLPAARELLTVDREAGKIVVKEIEGLL